MVTSIARQSVILKCLRRKSILLGNYEFYYLAGLMNHCFGISCSREMQPQEMIDYILEELPSLSPKNEQEEYLIKLVSTFRPVLEVDEQMRELFDWGESEENLWQVTTERRGTAK